MPWMGWVPTVPTNHPKISQVSTLVQALLLALRGVEDPAHTTFPQRNIILRDFAGTICCICLKGIIVFDFFFCVCVFIIYHILSRAVSQKYRVIWLQSSPIVQLYNVQLSFWWVQESKVPSKTCISCFKIPNLPWLVQTGWQAQLSPYVKCRSSHRQDGACPGAALPSRSTYVLRGWAGITLACTSNSAMWE